MSEKIQIKRGNLPNLPNLSNGEFALTTDTKDVYIGTPTGNTLVGGETVMSQLAEKATEINTVKTDLSTNYAKKTEVNSLATSKADKAELDTQKSRIDNLIAVGSSTDNAETADIRVGVGGSTFASAGEAIRSQLNYKVSKIDGGIPLASLYVPIAQMELHATDKSVTSTGTLQDTVGCKVYKLNIPKNVRYLTVSFMATTGAYPYYGGTTRGRVISPSTPKTQGDSGYILFNYGGTWGVNGVTLNFYPNGGFSKKVDKFIVDLSENLHSVGAILNGAMDYSIADYSCYKITDLTYDYYLETYAGNYGSCYDSNNVYLGALTKTTDGMLSLKANTAYFIVNVPNTNALYMKVKTQTTPAPTTTELIAGDITDRPFNFSGKTAALFGDSIAYGISGTDGIRTANRWINLFSNKVGLTTTNYAAGGARFITSTSPCIVDQVKNNTITQDFIIIAGGTNDYGKGAPLGVVDSTNTTDVYGALNNLCSYLKTTYPTKTVIFITPIGRVAAADTFVADINTYRNIIKEVAVKNGFNVVDGSQFSFPTKSGTYASLVLPDTLHPGDIGYEMYAKCVKAALC